MTTKEFANISESINAVWKDTIVVGAGMKMWFETFRNYDCAALETAVREYVATNKFKPTPADILEYIPAAKPAKAFVPKLETLPDGKRVRVISCRRCMDTGLIAWDDAEGYKMGRLCTCAAARANFGAGLFREAYGWEPTKDGDPFEENERKNIA